MKLGRPAKFSTPEDMQAHIEEYFAAMSSLRKSPSITGLAYHLGFESRQSFYDYEEIEQFSYTVKRARLAIENVYEEALMGKSYAGAIFALKNFGWRDKQEIETTGKQTIEVAWDKGLLPPTD